jgi:hypothetical protein
VVCSAAIAFSARAEPLKRELGEHLRYVRVHEVPADLPPPDSSIKGLILDLRNAQAESANGNAFGEWIAAQSKQGAPIFVLVNTNTAMPLREYLKQGKHGKARLVTIGRPATDLSPDIEIETTPEEESRAYDALAKDASVESLTTENADKPRVDEASIMRSRNDPDSADAETLLPDVPLPDPTAATPNATPPAPIDRALQRAIHLHRALLALKPAGER